MKKEEKYPLVCSGALKRSLLRYFDHQILCWGVNDTSLQTGSWGAVFFGVNLYEGWTLFFSKNKIL